MDDQPHVPVARGDYGRLSEIQQTLAGRDLDARIVREEDCGDGCSTGCSKLFVLVVPQDQAARCIEAFRDEFAEMAANEGLQVTDATIDLEGGETSCPACGAKFDPRTCKECPDCGLFLGVPEE